MDRCDCGSYAINIEKDTGNRCDVCHYKYDAERFIKFANYLVSERTDEDDNIVACNTVDELRAAVDSL